MKLSIDTEDGVIRTTLADGSADSVPLYSPAGFRLLSGVWIKQQWNALHWQTHSWLGYPIWQFTDDLLRLQELVASIAPDLIVETGTARGGTSTFFASLCRLLGKGRVVSVDVRVPPAVRTRIEQDRFSDLITLIEGNSVDPGVVARVHELAAGADKVFVFLDSNHSKEHVRRELDCYAGLVSPGSYVVATDGIMQSLADTPRGMPEWRDDNPAAAAREFAAAHPEFALGRPPALFGKEYVQDELTYWPDAYLLRLPG